MKMHRYPKMFLWVIVILFLMSMYSCRSARPKPAPASSQSPPATSEPAPTPPKTSPPQQPSPSTGKPAAPPPKETAPLPSDKTLPEKTYFTHTVKWGGETLFIIAAWYTGDRDNWRALAQAMTRENPNVSIHRIRVGNKIPVPESLMKVRDPMPKDFVDNYYQTSKPEKPPSKPAPAQKEEEEPKLFGPKELPKK